MNLREAQTIADALVGEMAPFCHRIEIAGSIRRKVSQVKDIEIVAIPKWENREPASMDTLFEVSGPVPVNLLYRWAVSQANMRWIKPGTSDIVDWPLKPDGKYWRGLVPPTFVNAAGPGTNSLKLDLFLANETNWGVIFAIRTGSAEFSEALVTHAKLKTYYHVADGHLKRLNETVPCPEEAELFKRLHLEWVEPEKRSSKYSVREVRF